MSYQYLSTNLPLYQYLITVALKCYLAHDGSLISALLKTSHAFRVSHELMQQFCSAAHNVSGTQNQATRLFRPRKKNHK